MHGGSSNQPAGEQHPGFRHGRFARYGTAKLQRLIATVRRDPGQQSPQHDVILFAAWMQLLLQKVRHEGRDLAPADEDRLMKLSAAKMAALDRELRQMQLATGYVSRADVLALGAALAGVVDGHVPDDDLKRAIAQEFRRIYAQRGIHVALPSPTTGGRHGEDRSSVAHSEGPGADRRGQG